ncbi:MAG: alcohol acetyltransferase [Clostridia bacterium]|nr:alcohol acetyltransferase [Clostridia bacterium]
MTSNSLRWIKLDNAGKIFPGQNTRRWSNVFRLGVELKEEIDPEILKKALKITLERIPSLRVKMKKGFFWNYLEINDMECPVNPDIKNHCYRINFKENNGFLFRIYYHHNRIGIDFYHSLCDGYGGAVFLSTLTGEYLRLKGHSVSHNQFVLNVNEEPRDEELEDAYVRYSSSKAKYISDETHVYHKRGTELPLHLCNYTVCTMSLEKLRELSKGYGVTITELFAAILLDIHYRKQLSEGKTKKEVSVQIPVNLRKAFPSKTLRNFVLCLMVKINPRLGKYTFEEILKKVSLQLKLVNDEKALDSLMTRNVNIEKKAVKYVPLALKNFFIGLGFRINAEFSTSVLISNLGVITLPEDMKEHVERFFFFTGPGLVNGARCGVVTFGDKVAFTFSNRYKEDDIEREFLIRLGELGIPVTVTTNRGDTFSDIDNVLTEVNCRYPERVFIPTQKDRKAKINKHKIFFSERLERVFHV